MSKTKPQLVSGPVGPTLIRLTLPMVWGLLALMLFSVVDTFFIGQLGTLPLAAMGFIFPVVFIITGTAMGMGIGLSSVVSRAVGEGAHEKVARLTTDGYLLAGILTLILALIGFFTMDPLFRLLGADQDTLPLIRAYMVPWFMGIVFLVLPMAGNSALRATGDTKTPSLIMIVAGCVNVVLDPLLIFGWGPFPRLEMQGAAIATVLSYLVTFGASFYFLRYREHLLVFTRVRWSEVTRSWRSILYVAVPAICTNLMVPLGTGIITRILSGYGPTAVAAYGVGTRLESLALAGCFAFSTAMAAFAGQNFGAGQCDRVREGTRFGIKYCLTLNLVIWTGLALCAEPLAGLFNKDPDIIRLIKIFLWVVPLSYGPFGVMLHISATFNANNRPFHSAILFTVRMFVLTVPLALLGAHLAGAVGVFASIFIGNVLSGILACAMVFPYIRKEEQASTRRVQ